MAEPVGSEPGHRHPVLVLQRDEVSASALDTVVVCILTSNKRLARAPGNVLLPRSATGLSKDSVVNASQMLTLDRADLDKLVGQVSPKVMDGVDDGIRWFLGLDWS